MRIPFAPPGRWEAAVRTAEMRKGLIKQSTVLQERDESRAGCQSVRRNGAVRTGRAPEERGRAAGCEQVGLRSWDGLCAVVQVALWAWQLRAACPDKLNFCWLLFCPVWPSEPFLCALELRDCAERSCLCAPLGWPCLGSLNFSARLPETSISR